jgi:hypothetical protein
MQFIATHELPLISNFAGRIGFFYTSNFNLIAHWNEIHDFR